MLKPVYFRILTSLAESSFCVPLFKMNLGTQLLDKETLQLKIVGLD